MPSPAAADEATAAEDDSIAARNAEIHECRRQINTWRARLESLEKEREKDVLLAKLRHDANRYAFDLCLEQRRDEDILLASIRSKNPMVFFVYVAKDNYEEGLRLRKPLKGGSPFIPIDMLGRKDIALALMELPDFRDGIESFMRIPCLRVPKALHLPDREVLMALYTKCPRAFELASDEMKNDREVVLAMLKVNDNGFPSDGSRFIPEKFWNDKEVILTVLRNPNSSGSSIKWEHIPATSPLRDDRDIAIAGIKPNLEEGRLCSHTSYVFPQLSARLRADREIVMMALANHEGCCSSFVILKHCMGKIAEDKDIVMRLCQRNGEELKHAPSFQGDRDVVLAACSNSGGALQYCAPGLCASLLSDRAFVRSCAHNCGGDMLDLLPEEMQDDEDIVLAAIQEGSSDQFVFIPERLQTCKKFLLKALGKCSPMYTDVINAGLPEEDEYDYLRSALMGDAVCLLAEMGCLADQIDFVQSNARLLSDKELIISMLNQRVWHDEYSDYDNDYFVTKLLPMLSGFTNDLDFILAACKQDGRCIRSSSEELQNDFRVIEAALASEYAFYIIDEVPEWAQLRHPNLVVEFLERISVADWTAKDVFDLFSEQTWLEHTCAVAFAARYESALLYLPVKYRSEREVVIAAISQSYHAMRLASSPLKDDSKFLRRAIQEDTRCLLCASVRLQNDFSMQVSAIATSERAVSCYTSHGWKSRPGHQSDASDFDAKVDFARRVGDKIRVKDSFILNFCGVIDICRPAALPSKQSVLVGLSMGKETSMVLKRLIAEFAGVPLGRELNELKKASEHLAVCGF